MTKKKAISILFASAALLFAAFRAYPASGPSQPQTARRLPYSDAVAMNSLINPHNQINDEGEVLWNTCQVCHKNVPGLKKERNIKDVRLRTNDMNEVCTRCHPFRPHPGADGAEITMSGITAPDHLVAPSKKLSENMRMSLKETPLLLPMDYRTGKIVCSTCHNPHQRGLLTGRADYGADSETRLRSAGLDICQYCHRK